MNNLSQMKFKKLFIIKHDDAYIMSLTKHPEYEAYFTTEEGFNQISALMDERVVFQQLPTPLLKQIK